MKRSDMSKPVSVTCIAGSRAYESSKEQPQCPLHAARAAARGDHAESRLVIEAQPRNTEDRRVGQVRGVHPQLQLQPLEPPDDRKRLEDRGVDVARGGRAQVAVARRF